MQCKKAKVFIIRGKVLQMKMLSVGSVRMVNMCRWATKLGNVGIIQAHASLRHGRLDGHLDCPPFSNDPAVLMILY